MSGALARSLSFVLEIRAGDSIPNELLDGSASWAIEPRHVERAHKIVPIVSVQNRYSFADREWDYLVNYCEQNRIAFIPWFPLGAGRVAGQVLNRIAQTHHSGPLQIAIAWLLRRSPVMLPIPGTSSIEHLEENMTAASLRLTEEEYEELSGVAEPVGSR